MRPLLLALLLVVLAACDVLGDGHAAQGTVDAVAEAHLVVDAVAYAVTNRTVFEGYTGLADVRVGDRVEVDFEARNGERVATDVARAV